MYTMEHWRGDKKRMNGHNTAVPVHGTAPEGALLARHSVLSFGMGFTN